MCSLLCQPTVTTANSIRMLIVTLPFLSEEKCHDININPGSEFLSRLSLSAGLMDA